VCEDITTRCSDQHPVIALMRAHGHHAHLGSLYYYLYCIYHDVRLDTLPADDAQCYFEVVAKMAQRLLREGMVLEQWNNIGGCSSTICHLKIMLIWHHALLTSLMAASCDPLLYISKAITSLKHITKHIDANEMCIPCRLLLADMFRGMRCSIFESLVQMFQ